jgi:hypothetical protein
LRWTSRIASLTFAAPWTIRLAARLATERSWNWTSPSSAMSVNCWYIPPTRSRSASTSQSARPPLSSGKNTSTVGLIAWVN